MDTTLYDEVFGFCERHELPLCDAVAVMAIFAGNRAEAVRILQNPKPNAEIIEKTQERPGPLDAGHIRAAHRDLEGC